MLRFARFPILLSIALLAVFAVANAQTPQRDTRPRTASISGRVTISGKAAANVKIAITEVKDNPISENPVLSVDVSAALGGLGAGEYHVALTDADGRYRVTSLPEGKYQVRALLGGFVREKPAPNNSLFESVSLNEGELRENVDFALARGGVITGRVTDAEGRPLIAGAVSLQVVDEEGRKSKGPGPNLMELMMDSDMFQTDDLGVYRIFGLRAGRYLVSAGGDSEITLMTGAAGKYPRVWHPDAADENQAKVIEVNAGDEGPGIDIKLGVAKKTYDAVGRVVDDETGKPIVGAGVVCVKTKGAGESEAIDNAAFGRNSKTDEQGNFRLSGLASGQYHLSLADYESFLTGSGSSYYSDGAKFEIQGVDVAGVEIRAKRGATISGVVVIESADPSAKSSLSQTMIMAHSRPPSQPSSQTEADETALASAMMQVISRIGSDGGFSLRGVRPGKVEIMAVSVTGGLLKIARIERDGVDVSEGINVDAGREEIGGVRIILSKKDQEE
ncbi:MAG: MSCRAMM family protein [Blastocatellia bacterium]